MCAVEQDEATVLPETKEELVMNIMKFDEMESEAFPTIPDIIAHEQKKDSQLKEVMKKSEKFSERTIERSTVITYDGNIHVPQSLRRRLVWWYHTYLQDPGIIRMEATLRQNFVCPNLRKDVEAALNNFHKCQICKKVRNKYRELPEKLTERSIAWNRVDVELVGPLTIKTPSGNKELLCLTIIDPSTCTIPCI
jgi:hypothetical protein